MPPCQMPPTSPLPILAPRVQNAFLRDFHTALDDKFNLTNNGAGNLADFLTDKIQRRGLQFWAIFLTIAYQRVGKDKLNLWDTCVM